MLHDGRGRRLPIMLVLLLAAITPACEDPPEDEQDPPSDPTAQIRAFPGDSASNSRRESELAVLLGESVQANEVHDCQKLVLPTGEFGPLVGAYPLAVVGSDDPAVFATARPVATVFNWSSDGYEALGIERDWNCVWLAWDSLTDDWSARVIQPSREGCVATASSDGFSGGTPLDVHRLTHRGDADYPATARWGWGAGATDSVHYIGLPCGGAWCALGPAGFAPRESDLGLGGVAEVPGWYDDQKLAVPEGDGLVPGPWGRIRPVPGLDTLKAAHFQRAQVVAFVELEGQDSHLLHYDTTWNFKSPGTNTISLLNRDDEDEGGWFMIVEPPAAPADTFRIDRETGVMHAVAGAVRWRWDSTDESGWFGCDYACCTPQSSERVSS